MKKQPKSITKAFILAILLFACIALNGCGINTSKALETMFPREETSAPVVNDITGVKTASKQVHELPRPMVIDKAKATDKTLINPMFSLSTQAFQEITVLEGNDYFKYNITKAAECEEIDKLTEPTNISVALYDDSSYSRCSWIFSAFIYKIDYDYIYMGTAGHCVNVLRGSTPAKIIFYDRSEIYLNITDFIMGSNFRSEKGDYAMFRIPTSYVNNSLLMKLKEVSFDKAAIKNVKPGDMLYSGNIYARNTSKDYDKKMIVLDKSANDVQCHFEKGSWFKPSTYFLTDCGLVPGQSGSAIFDKYGKLIAICSGCAYYSGHSTIGIMANADKLDDLYERLSAKA